MERDRESRSTRANELLSCVELGFIPLKHAYVGTAAETHHRLVRSPAYAPATGDIDVEVELIRTGVVIQNPPAQVCEFGPGNGDHTVLVLDQLGNWVAKYLGLDFSRELGAKAQTAISTKHPALNVIMQQWDFESGPTDAINEWRDCSQPVISFMLGTTLSNPLEPEKCLSNIRASMQTDDFLLISVAALVNQTASDLIKPYLSEKFTAAALEPLRWVGIPLKNGRFEVEFDSESSCVLGWFEFRKTTQVEFAGTNFTFKKDHRVSCFMSRRFTAENVKKLLFDQGWVSKDEHIRIVDRTLCVLAKAN